MRYLIILLLAVAFPLSSLAGTTSGVSHHNSGTKQWASLFGGGGKHAKKANKQHKSKKSKNASKKQHRAKSSK